MPETPNININLLFIIFRMRHVYFFNFQIIFAFLRNVKIRFYEYFNLH